MNYKDIVKDLKGFEKEIGYKEVIKAIISYERDVEDEKVLNEVYEDYWESDYSLLNDYIVEILQRNNY